MIPEAAVEAAANLIVQGNRGPCECRRSIFDKHDVTPPCSTRIQALRIARAALEAAAPHMLAEQKIAAILHHLRGDNWFGGKTPKQYQPILDILDGVAK